MDAVGGDKTGQIALGQELPPHVDKANAATASEYSSWWR